MSSVILSESKSILAKLLAGENINVVHKRISTAMIDLKTRTLYCPIWEDMNGELYDLLMGHEVSHALHTPQEGWHSAITIPGTDKVDKAFKSVLNIVEDARIEKLIKRKYPGIAKSFVEGYKILFNRDFFGIKKLKDYSTLNLADRINLYAKCGAFLIVPFNDEERELMDAVNATETWEQVMEVAARLHEKMKEEQDSQMNSLDDLTEELLRQFEDGLEDMEDLDLSDDDSDEEPQPKKASKKSKPKKEEEEGEDAAGDDATEDEKEEGESADGSKPSDEEGDDEDDAEEGAGSGGDDDEESEDEDADDEDADEDGEDSDEESGSSDGAGENSEGDDEDDSPRSITDETFRERERELITDAVEVFTYNLPTPALDRIIVPNKVFVDNFYEQVAATKKLYRNSDPIVETCSKRFSQNNNRYINLLVKEFEMRKNASQYARTTVARTGELDMSKLHKYKYSNDLFKKISVVEKGKSHGMMMFVDMSISMDSMFGATMEQTLILVAFCRKVGIPFDVYGFCDSRNFIQKMIRDKKLPANFNGRKFDRTNDDNYTIADDSFHLVHFISSNLAGKQYHRAFDLMATVALNWHGKKYPKTLLNWENMGLSLGGTPFTQTVMASRPMIERFKADHKVDITNVIYLTDGDGTTCFTFPEVKPSAINPETGKPKFEQHIYMIDRKTKRRIEFASVGMYYNNHQKAMTQFVRSVTNCKHIGFYVGDSHSLRRSIFAAMGVENVEKVAAFEKFWKANGYYSLPSIGYDMYYYVSQGNENLDDDDYTLTEEMTSKKIAKVFSDAQSNKRKHRVLVSKFAQDIAA